MAKSNGEGPFGWVLIQEKLSATLGGAIVLATMVMNVESLLEPRSIRSGSFLHPLSGNVAIR